MRDDGPGRTAGPAPDPAARAAAPGATPPDDRTDPVALVAGLPAIRALAARVAAGAGAANVRGLVGSAAALLLAATAPARGTTLVVTADADGAEALDEDLMVLLGDPAATRLYPAFAARDPVQRLRDDRVLSARLSALHALDAGEGPRFLVAPVAAALDGAPSRERLRATRRRVAPGDAIPPGELAGLLDAARFARVARVEGPGEWALRGGILDVFPHGRGGPVRIEWWGDEVASVRRFDPASQRSFAEEAAGLAIDLLPREEAAAAADGGLTDHLPPDSWLVLADAAAIEDHVARVAGHADGLRAAWERFLAAAAARPVLRLSSAAPRGDADPDVPLRTAAVPDTARDPGALGPLLDRRASVDQRVLVYAGNAGEAARFRTLLDGAGLAPGRRDRIVVREGRLAHPFRLPALRTSLLSADALFERRRLRRPAAWTEPAAGATAPADVADLRPGDAVVHLGHGIAIFRGTEREERAGGVRESLVLEFRDGVRVLVPASRADLVHRYVGTREARPALSAYGGRDWARRTDEVAEAVEDVAAELLEVQALRALHAGIAHPPDGPEQAEFEASFRFEDTPDQAAAWRAVKADMEAPRPMDRLLCGDVGFGKTEIAVRAAFKAVMGGRQVAVLVPTTLLAQQHHETFRARFAGWPVTVEVLSRFRTKAGQRDVVARTAEGAVDVLVGTHRLLQPDVSFRDLGLVVIDEEQRFGVAHKQRLRALRATVDVLTMTATPIPRTLHMALLGLRDASNLETPPEGRQPIETEIRAWAGPWVRDAILRELDRGGRCYVVHDRIASIATLASAIQALVPEARVAVCHGRMHEDDIEETMLRFVDGGVDVLVATSIIENGLDIPSANTILIDRAHMFGLADLHQLRGRVGRGAHRAYCHLVVPDGPIAADAERRVRAVEEYAGLGEGYRIALRDLEIRGAGNLLGVQQSGHIASVGYEMYCTLLEDAVRRLRGEPVARTLECTIDLPVPAAIPETYVADPRERLGLYRRFARARTEDEIRRVEAEVRDRWGAPPAAVACVADLARARIAAAAAGAEYVFRPPEPDRVALRAADPERLAAALARHGPRVRRVDAREFHLLAVPARTTAAEVLRGLIEDLRPSNPGVPVPSPP